MVEPRGVSPYRKINSLHRLTPPKGHLGVKGLFAGLANQASDLGGSPRGSDNTVGAGRAEIGAEIRDDVAEILPKDRQLALIAAE
jgi:hypothetical protein